MKFDKFSYFFLEINKSEKTYNSLDYIADLPTKSHNLFINKKTDTYYNLYYFNM